jgi:hypothetical protein
LQPKGFDIIREEIEKKERKRVYRRPERRKYSRGTNQDGFVTEINVAIEYNVCKLSRVELTFPQCRLSLDLKSDYTATCPPV